MNNQVFTILTLHLECVWRVPGGVFLHTCRNQILSEESNLSNLHILFALYNNIIYTGTRTYIFTHRKFRDTIYDWNFNLYIFTSIYY